MRIALFNSLIFLFLFSHPLCAQRLSESSSTQDYLQFITQIQQLKDEKMQWKLDSARLTHLFVLNQEAATCRRDYSISEDLIKKMLKYNDLPTNAEKEKISKEISKEFQKAIFPDTLPHRDMEGVYFEIKSQNFKNGYLLYINGYMEISWDYGLFCVIRKNSEGYRIVFLKKQDIEKEGVEFDFLNEDFFYMNHVITKGFDWLSKDYRIYRIENHIVYPCLSYAKIRQISPYLEQNTNIYARSEFISNRGFEMEYDFAIFPYLRMKRNGIDFDDFLINHTYKAIYTWNDTYKKFFFDEKASNRDNNCRFKITANKLAFFNDVRDEVAFIHVFGEELKDALLNPPDENTKKALIKYLLLVDKEIISKR